MSKKGEPPVVYSTPHKGLALFFIFQFRDKNKDFNVSKGLSRTTGIARIVVGANLKKVLELHPNKAGSLYTVEKEGFYTKPKHGLGVYEFRNKKPVKILSEQQFKSTKEILAEILKTGDTELYFTPAEILERYKWIIKNDIFNLNNFITDTLAKHKISNNDLRSLD